MIPHDQSVTLPNDQINTDFVQTHIIYYNPDNALEWMSLNGVRGSFNETYDSLFVLSGPPRGDEQISFFRDPFSLFAVEKSEEHAKKIHVLRVSEIDINGAAIRIVLISEPVEYDGCTWSGPSLMTSGTSPNSLASSLRNMYNSNPSTPTEDSPTLKRSSSTMSVVGGDSDAVDYGGDIPIQFLKSASKSNKPSNTLINNLINMHNISNGGLFAEQMEKNNEKNKKKFSFQDFVDKMRHKSAINLVRKIKKFIYDVNKNDYTEDLPDRVINFLSDVMQEISEHSQWKNASEQEMDNAREGIEKYVMTKIYSKYVCIDY